VESRTYIARKNTKNHKFKLLKRNINTINILEFKKANAKCRRAIKEAKKNNIIQFYF